MQLVLSTGQVMAYSWFTYNDSTSDPSHAPPPPADPHGFSDDQFEDLMGSKDIFFLQVNYSQYYYFHHFYLVTHMH